MITWDSLYEIPDGASVLPSAYKVVLANELATVSVTSTASAIIDYGGNRVSVSFTVPADQSGVLQPGKALYQVLLTDPGFEKVLESGSVSVQQNLNLIQAGAAFDSRPTSIVEKTFQAIENFLLGKASGLEMKMVINGRELQSFPPDQLIKIRNYYAQLVRNERGKGLGFARTVRFRTGA